MQSISVVRRLHQHRGWVNQKLLDAAGQLGEEQLRAGFPIGQGSIWKSLVHLYAAEYVWLEALTGNQDPLAPGDVRGKLPGNQQGAQPIESLPDLRQKWTELEQRSSRFLDELELNRLDEPVVKVNSMSGQRAATRRIDVLLHVCTHAHYTTAQVINMLRHVGLEPLPDPMLISLARQEFSGSRD